MCKPLQKTGSFVEKNAFLISVQNCKRFQVRTRSENSPVPDARHLNALLRVIEDDPHCQQIDETVSSALASSNHRIVGRAAKLVGKRNLEQFESELREAYARFLVDPIKTDPGCKAKTPLCEALRLLEHDLSLIHI